MVARLLPLVSGAPAGPGGVPLSRALGRSTMGAAGFHGRVRDGIGWGTRAVAAGSGGRPGWGGWAGWLGTGGRSRPPGGGAAAGAGELSRAIRTGRLRASPRLHPRPIDVVVCHGPV